MGVWLSSGAPSECAYLEESIENDYGLIIYDMEKP